MHDLRERLSKHGLTQIAEVLEREHIDWEALLALSESDLRDLALAIGPRAKLLAALRSLPGEVFSPAGNFVIANGAKHRLRNVLWDGYPLGFRESLIR